MVGAALKEEPLAEIFASKLCTMWWYVRVRWIGLASYWSSFGFADCSVLAQHKPSMSSSWQRHIDKASSTRRRQSRGNEADKLGGFWILESRRQIQAETTAIVRQLNRRKQKMTWVSLKVFEGVRIVILNCRELTNWPSLNPTGQFEPVATYRPQGSSLFSSDDNRGLRLRQLSLIIFWWFMQVIFFSHAFVSRRFNESWRNTNVETVDLCMEGTSSLVPGKKSDTCPTWKRESALDYYLIVSNTKRRHYIRRRRRLANKNRIQHGVVEGNHKPIKKLL
jgi:hypothetical protein